MSTGSKKIWNPVLDIPEGTVGTTQVRHVLHPPGTVLQTASMRTAMHAGHVAEEVRFEEETRWHELSSEGGVWMTDLPIEQAQADSHLQGFRGSVLVGGLGLGYAATRLCQMDEVTSVVVAEISGEVIELVEPHIRHDKMAVLHADIFEVLKNLKADPSFVKEFDHAFYDIWRSDGEHTLHEVVVPLRRSSVGVVSCDANVICWNEDVMRGQLYMTLLSRLAMLAPSETTRLKMGMGMKSFSLDEMCKPDDSAGAIYWNWMIPYWRWLRKAGVDLTDANNFSEAARWAMVYTGLYGRPNWEERWKSMDRWML